MPVIILAQFLCTSMWFAGNAVIPELTALYTLPSQATGHLTAAVQFGFLAGTLLFGIFTIPDRYSPAKVFLLSALAGALFNVAILLPFNNLFSLLSFRFFTGFFLAGIYPVGMKIAADYQPQGLGKALGFLVGALVLGTALPHLIRATATDLPTLLVIWGTTSLAAVGGLLMYFLVPDGPYRKKGSPPNLSQWINIFENRQLKGAALGYFGHMWELYTFWAFVPLMLQFHQINNPGHTLNLSYYSFIIISVGGMACVASGYTSVRIGARKTANFSLLLSGICCLVSPALLIYASFPVLLTFLCFWGAVVVADSPMFSTLVAQNARPESKGTALIMVNCIGFGITIISIQLLTWLQAFMPIQFMFLLLALGPACGLWGHAKFR